MIYLDNIVISVYNAMPIIGNGDYPLEGIFSLPARDGETERNWGDVIEAYVELEEIAFKPRTLVLNAYIKESTQQAFTVSLTRFKEACINTRKLSTGFAEFNVLLNGEVKVDPFFERPCAKIQASFIEQDVAIPELTILATEGLGWCIDNYNLYNDFQIGISKAAGFRDVGKRIEVSTTAPYPLVEYRDPTMIALSCFMEGSDYSDIYNRMKQFHALCAKNGLRTIRHPNGQTVTGYIKDGVSVLPKISRLLTFDLKIRTL